MQPAQEKYKYEYNGKEFQGEFSLNWNDYGARNYDASLGRWVNLDALAEKYVSFSPYIYVADNPTKFVDKNGEKIYIADNVNDALTKLAQIVITNKGQIRINKLINSYFTYTMKNVFWTSSSGYSKKRKTIYYPSSVWMLDIDGGAPNSVYSLSHEVEHAFDDEMGYYISRKGYEYNAVYFANYMRSVYNEQNMRTIYFGLGLEFDSNPDSYNRKNEKIENFKEINKIEKNGFTVLSFSYTKKIKNKRNNYFVISLRRKDGTYMYRILDNDKDYKSTMDRINNFLNKKKDEN